MTKSIKIAALVSAQLFGLVACQPSSYDASIAGVSPSSFASVERWRAVYEYLDNGGNSYWDARKGISEAYWVTLTVAGDRGSYLSMNCAGQDTSGPNQSIGYNLTLGIRNEKTDQISIIPEQIRARVTGSKGIIFDQIIENRSKEGERISENGNVSFFSPRKLTLAIREGNKIVLSLPRSGDFTFTLNGSTAATDEAGCHVVY